MSFRSVFSISAICLMFIGVFDTSAYAQGMTTGKPVNFAQRNLGGPRLGLTYVPSGKLQEELNEHNIGNLLSQFGWHFEYNVMPVGMGPAFVIQLVPMIAGVEYGKPLPHATLAMGIRMPNGIEFGLGPNLLVTKDSLFTSLVLGVGKSFNYSGVNIPINLTLSTNPDGYRISFVFGYAINQRRYSN